MTLIACSLAPAACAARVQIAKAFPVWFTFCLFGAARGSWFTLDAQAWKTHWQWTEFCVLLLQAAVTLEALAVMAGTVRNFSAKWRLLGVLLLPAVGAAALSKTDYPFYTTALFANQVAGFGLGVLAALASIAALMVGPVCSPRSVFHAAIVSGIFLLTGIGYRFYSTPIGSAVAHWAPVFFFLAWASLTGSMDGMVPDPDPEETERQRVNLKRSRAAIG